MPLSTTRRSGMKPLQSARITRRGVVPPPVSYLRFLEEERAQCLLACEDGSDEAPPRLTARELEVLRWTMEGKTAWETGAILGIS